MTLAISKYCWRTNGDLVHAHLSAVFTGLHSMSTCTPEILPHSDVSLLSCFSARCAHLLLFVLILQFSPWKIYQTKYTLCRVWCTVQDDSSAVSFTSVIYRETVGVGLFSCIFIRQAANTLQLIGLRLYIWTSLPYICNLQMIKVPLVLVTFIIVYLKCGPSDSW